MNIASGGQRHEMSNEDTKTESPYRWRVDLKGESLDLESLSNALTDEGMTRITQEDGAFSLVSDRFEKLDDVSDVLAEARDLVAELNGAAWLEWDNAEPITVGGVFERAEGGGWTASVFAAVARGRSRVHAPAVALVNGENVAPTPPPRPQQILTAAESDEPVRDVLHLLGGEPTWYGLYKALEILEYEGALNETAVSKARLKAFSRNANYYHRHGDSRWKYAPPRRRVSLEEAQKLVREVVNEWLEQRVPRQTSNAANAED